MLATEAKTSGKYQHFQVKFNVIKVPATIVSLQYIETDSVLKRAKTGREMVEKMHHFIQHEMRFHR